MEFLHELTEKEKATIVCLYYAQLHSTDVAYKGICHPRLKLLAKKYSMKYGNLKNDKDAFDALFDNGRKGWTDKPLEKRSAYLHGIYEEYGCMPLDNLQQCVERIYEEATRVETLYFSIKTKAREVVSKILAQEDNIELSGLNILKDHIRIGQLLFIVLGGDKPSWDPGLVGMAVVSREPYDIDYDGKNYKIAVDMKILVTPAIKRTDLIPYRNTYGIIGIGPIVKWEPNQAISQVPEDNAVALMRAMLELNPTMDSQLQSIVPTEIFNRIKGATVKMVEVEVDFDESVSSETGSEAEDDILETPTEIYTKEDFLKEVYIEEVAYHTICNLLEYKKNVILEGAPGVGKTFAAKRLAYSIIGYKNDDLIQMVQFHQSYGYEDFVAGFRPTETGYGLADGPFYTFCQKANASPESKFFFIIDEINRGNLSKIFGELLMLIEADKRSQKVNILYKNEEFSIPENVYIIGMMNTADRSLAMIDYALRRRFSFYPMSPGFDSDGFKMRMSEVPETKLGALVSKIKELNVQIAEDDSLGAGFQIGHSYFCGADTITNQYLQMIVQYELIPLLREYWFDEPDKIERWSRTLLGAVND